MIKADWRLITAEINEIAKQLKELKEKREAEGRCSTINVPRLTVECDDRYDEEPERHEKSESDEWKEDDDARRYSEWKSDQRSYY